MHQNIWQKVSLGAWIPLWLILVSNCLFLCSTVSSEETSQERVLSTSGSSPRIQLNETSFDFGEVAPNEKATHRFTFQNVGAMPLKISEVKSSCKCITTHLASPTIEPGGSGFIEVTFDSTGRFGLERVSIRLFTNDPLNPKISIRIRAIVKGDFEVSSRAFLFSDVVIGREVVETISVTPLEDVSFRVNHVESDSKYFVPIFSEVRMDGGKRDYIISVKFNPPMTGWKVSGKAKKQFLTSKIRILTDSPRQSAIEVRAVASRKGD
jgi:hypothetical protein